MVNHIIRFTDDSDDAVEFNYEREYQNLTVKINDGEFVNLDARDLELLSTFIASAQAAMEEE